MKKIICALAIIATGCSVIETPGGETSLLDVLDEPAGLNCATGGIKIVSGLDSNNDGALDPDEVTSTKFVCNLSTASADDGIKGLIATTEIAPGVLCSSGGIQIDSGPDMNNNGVLDRSEIAVTKIVCNGVDGLVDKQARFKLPEDISYNGSQVITSGQNNLYKFDIDYFTDVDSVVYSVSSTVPNSGNFCTIDLYDVTDDVPIAGSKIIATTNAGQISWQSSNFINSFPHNEITLGLRFSGAFPGQTVNVTGGYLYLYRK